MISMIQLASCYSWRSSWELWDLEANDASFINEANAWSASSYVTPGVISSKCGDDYLLGGYNVLGGTKGQYFERTFTGLPPHNQLNLSYIIYPLDSWDSNDNDHYEIYVDGYYQIGWVLAAGSYGQSTCGSDTWKDFPPVLAISTFVHNTSSLTLRFIHMLDQKSNDESFGIREVKMKFVNVTTPQYSLCGRSMTNVPLPKWPCTECDSSHQYIEKPASGTCFECAESCATCNTNGCTSCYTGKYVDGTACKQCASTCATCVKSANYCLTCQPELFMASNSCYPTCTYPLSATESGREKYCNSPCSGNQYAMWDGSCSSTCPSELTATTISGFPVCTFPCSIPQVNDIL